MAAGDKSAVIRTRRKELIGIIQRDPESVVDELLAHSAISEEEYDSLAQVEDTVARIRKLLIYIQRRGEPACRAFLECLDTLFPGTQQPRKPSEYDFFNPERDSRPVRNPEPRERDFFNPEHQPKAEEEDGLTPKQGSETLPDPEPEEKEDCEKESDIERDLETGNSDLEQEPQTQQDPEADEETGSNPEQESEPEPDPEGSNSEQESDPQ